MGFFTPLGSSPELYADFSLAKEQFVSLGQPHSRVAAGQPEAVRVFTDVPCLGGANFLSGASARRSVTFSFGRCAPGI